MATNTTKNTAKKNVKTNNTKAEWPSSMPFQTINYLLMGVGVVILILGYILLSGGGSDDPT